MVKGSPKYSRVMDHSPKEQVFLQRPSNFFSPGRDVLLERKDQIKSPNFLFKNLQKMVNGSQAVKFFQVYTPVRKTWAPPCTSTGQICKWKAHSRICFLDAECPENILESRSLLCQPRTWTKFSLFTSATSRFQFCTSSRLYVNTSLWQAKIIQSEKEKLDPILINGNCCQPDICQFDEAIKTGRKGIIIGEFLLDKIHSLRKDTMQQER